MTITIILKDFTLRTSLCQTASYSSPPCPMKAALTTILPVLASLAAFVFTVSAKEGQEPKAVDDPKEGDAQSTAIEEWFERLNQGPRINLDDPSTPVTGGPPPPPFDLNRGGDGRRTSRVVFFISPPLENGEQEIVVPLRHDPSGNGWLGQNNMFTNFDLRTEQQPGIPFHDAAFIEGPEDYPVGCYFLAGIRGAGVIPKPIFYGEFSLDPVPRVTSILCSSDIHEIYKDEDRFGTGDAAE